MHDDIESEILDAQYRAMVRSRVLLEPCPHCGAIPKIEARDLYGYPRATGCTHEPTCFEFTAD